MSDLDPTCIGTHHSNGVFFRQHRQGFLEKFHYPACRAAVLTPQPAVQQKVSLGQHRHEWMMRGSSRLAWIRPAQRTLLPTVALVHRRVQVQTVSRTTLRKPLELPTPQAGEKNAGTVPGRSA